MDWKSKLTSRKFWAAIANFVSMLAIALGAGESASTQIVAIIMAGAGVIAYIVGEGLIDAANAGAVYGEIVDEADTGTTNKSEITKPPESGATM